MFELIKIPQDPERDWIPRFAIWNTVNSQFLEVGGEQAWDTFEEFAEVCSPDLMLRDRVRRLDRDFWETLRAPGGGGDELTPEL